MFDTERCHLPETLYRKLCQAQNPNGFRLFCDNRRHQRHLVTAAITALQLYYYCQRPLLKYFTHDSKRNNCYKWIKRTGRDFLGSGLSFLGTRQPEFILGQGHKVDEKGWEKNI